MKVEEDSFEKKKGTRGEIREGKKGEYDQSTSYIIIYIIDNAYICENIILKSIKILFQKKKERKGFLYPSHSLKAFIA
jgi:hypothetical protein